MDRVEFQKLFNGPVRNGLYKSKEFQGHGVRLVKMNQLFGERRIRSNADGYDRIELSEQEKQTLLLAKNDLLFSRTSVVADGVGKCSLVLEADEELTWDSNIIRVKLDPNLACAEFYFYFFNAPEGRDAVKKLSSGAAVTTITGSGLAASLVPAPSLPAQRRIAGILSAYDELIENNQRRIKILEGMARSLYREWFVSFRYPGHEKVPLVDSSLGPIPKGWEVKRIADMCESVSYGFTESASREEVGPKFLRITDIVPEIIDWDNVPYCEMSDNNVTKYLLLPGDIVVARTEQQRAMQNVSTNATPQQFSPPISFDSGLNLV
jgi:type I restriction enzyme, S subunit